jgi:hypothetical protein
MAMSGEGSVRVTEAYHNYAPPFDVAKVVQRLLSEVPDHQLVQLDCVVLTNSEALPRRDRKGRVWSRNRKYNAAQIRGRYHPKSGSNLPWIEMRVDKVVRGLPRPVLWFSFFRNWCVGDVLYHELGHHIHYCVRPEHREKEDVADDWSKRLLRAFMKKHHWILFAVLGTFVWLLRRIPGVQGWIRSKQASQPS